RRRHTRFSRDWSSDVCSSDLGQFLLPDLPEGPHWIGYLDPTGAHGSEFHPDSPNVPDATPVTVTGGATAVADGSLPAQVPVAGEIGRASCRARRQVSDGTGGT